MIQPDLLVCNLGAVRTKLVADTGLSAFSINVDTSDGVVTLSGTVSSHEEIAKAMKLAMEAGRLSFLAGRMSKKFAASASSPTTGLPTPVPR